MQMLSSPASPTPLPSHAVSLLLSCIASLHSPIPFHLLSTPLRQRIQFLGLGDSLYTAQDAAAYLSWPSCSGSEQDFLSLVDLLNALPDPENADPMLHFQTKYFFDGEAVYAHAHIPVKNTSNGHSRGLRLIFRWEAADAVQADGGLALSANAENWKYHDAKPMPYPSDVHDSPQDALLPGSTAPVEDVTPTRTNPITPFSGPIVTIMDTVQANSDSDDDAYWDSYGRSGSDDEDGGYLHNSTVMATKDDDDEKAEEAYWAQYNSVHGTADSTRHSPLPQRRRLHDPAQPVAFQPSSDYTSCLGRSHSQDILTSEVQQPTVYDPYRHEEMEHRRRFYAATGRETSPDGVPSPEAIARRLHNLSITQPDLENEVIVDQRLDDNGPPSPEALSPDTSDGQTLTPPGNIETTAIPEIPLTTFASKKIDSGNQIDSALHEAIQGIYRLWSATRGDKHGLDSTARKDGFVAIVRDALEGI